jgi:hypothetical protein
MVPTTKQFLVIALLCVPLPVFGQEIPQTGKSPSPETQASTAASAPAKAYAIECYFGNPNQQKYMGGVSVTAVHEAGPACNTTFFSCKGKCYGCFSDFDFMEDFCMDNAGRKCLR